VSTASTTEAAIAMPKFSTPGRPIKRKMTTGRVGRSGRARNAVAPNSPSEVANPKPIARPRPRSANGTSRVSRVRHGLAPRVAAASCRCGSIARRVGRIARTTSGRATIAWAIGISTHDDRRSSGGRLRVIRKPNPTVTAETPSGSMNTESTTRSVRWPTREPGRRDST